MNSQYGTAEVDVVMAVRLAIGLYPKVLALMTPSGEYSYVHCRPNPYVIEDNTVKVVLRVAARSGWGSGMAPDESLSETTSCRRGGERAFGDVTCPTSKGAAVV